MLFLQFFTKLFKTYRDYIKKPFNTKEELSLKTCCFDSSTDDLTLVALYMCPFNEHFSPLLL